MQKFLTTLISTQPAEVCHLHLIGFTDSLAQSSDFGPWNRFTRISQNQISLYLLPSCLLSGCLFWDTLGHLCHLCLSGPGIQHPLF